MGVLELIPAATGHFLDRLPAYHRTRHCSIISYYSILYSIVFYSDLFSDTWDLQVGIYLCTNGWLLDLTVVLVLCSLTCEILWREATWQNMRGEEGNKRLCMIKEVGGEETKDCVLYYLSPASVSLHYLSLWAACFCSGQQQILFLWFCMGFMPIVSTSNTEFN